MRNRALKIFTSVASVVFLLLMAKFSFSETLTFKCSYETYSDQEGLHKAEDGFVLTFIVDDESGKSFMVGNQGSTQVHYIDNAFGFTFLELTDTGNVMTTSISTKKQSVHSRNTIMFGDIVPTQYYGECIYQ